MIRPHSSSFSRRSLRSSLSADHTNALGDSQGTGATVRTPREPACAFLAKQETTLVANDSRKSNRILSYAIPPILVAAAIYSCYCWYYLCDSWFIRNGRRRTGVCLIVFQVILLLLMAACFFRVLLTPAGYLPNAQDRAIAARKDPEHSGRTDNMPESEPDPEAEKSYGVRPSAKEVRAFLQAPPLDCQRIWIARNDATDGTRYCAACQVTKYDRVHHCSEINRCVRKFDHFCPWVGGALGQTRYKFFFQFVTYVALYCIFLVITFGVAVAQRKAAIGRNDGTFIPSNVGLWYSCIALGGLFGLMMVPFSFFHGRQILLNLTTLESIDAHNVTVIYQTPRKGPDGEEQLVKERVTLSTDLNPFNVGLWQNWQQVMGEFKADRWMLCRILNWILPVQESPGDGLFFAWNPSMLRELERREANRQVTLLSESIQTAASEHAPVREKLGQDPPGI